MTEHLRFSWALLFDVSCVYDRQQTPVKLWDKSCNEVRKLGHLLKCLSHEVNTLLLQQKSSTSIRQSFIQGHLEASNESRQARSHRPSPFQTSFCWKKKPNICIHIYIYIYNKYLNLKSFRYYLFLVQAWLSNDTHDFLCSRWMYVTKGHFVRKCLPNVVSRFSQEFSGRQKAPAVAKHRLTRFEAPQKSQQRPFSLRMPHLMLRKEMDEQISFIPNNKTVMVLDFLLP